MVCYVSDSSLPNSLTYIAAYEYHETAGFWQLGIGYTPDPSGDNSETYFEGYCKVNWKEFGAWIHKKIDGDSSWKICPIDTRKSREVIIESIIKLYSSGGNKTIELFVGLILLF